MQIWLCCKNIEKLVFIDTNTGTNLLSELGSITAGVLQVLYYSFYTDNLTNLARRFADDNSLSFSWCNYVEMEIDIQWTKTWLVDFNPKKTKALVFFNNFVPNLNIKFNNENVEIVKNQKHLG